MRLRAEREARSTQDVARQAVYEYTEKHSRAELVDGNNRLALPATIASLGINGVRLALTNDTLDLPLRPPASVPNSEYRYSERIEGVKHFGVWPLSEAAHACFDIREWPATHAIPQSTIEFAVDDVEAAAAELQREGYVLVHPVRTEPWGQVLARFQSADEVLLGVCSRGELTRKPNPHRLRLEPPRRRRGRQSPHR